MSNYPVGSASASTTSGQFNQLLYLGCSIKPLIMAAFIWNTALWCVGVRLFPHFGCVTAVSKVKKRPPIFKVVPV